MQALIDKLDSECIFNYDSNDRDSLKRLENYLLNLQTSLILKDVSGIKPIAGETLALIVKDKKEEKSSIDKMTGTYSVDLTNVTPIIDKKHEKEVIYIFYLTYCSISSF